MRVRVPASCVWILRWAQRMLFGGAFLLLGYCGFVLADAWRFQRDESREFSQELVSQQLVSQPVSQPADEVPGADVPPPNPLAPGLFGRIDIDRLGVSVVVMEGTTAHTLQRAVGHIEGTALPGERGNVGISGHRDTLFRPLRNIRQNDIVTLTTLAGEYRYRVVLTTIVNPENVSVLASDGSDILTLVTCYPFYFVGPAPKRFIVRAQRIV